jgi:hypothetical protein
MNEQDLRDCFAMFAMLREDDPTKCYAMADAMIEARNKNNEEVELGIAAFKPKRQYTRKADYK